MFEVRFRHRLCFCTVQSWAFYVLDLGKLQECDQPTLYDVYADTMPHDSWLLSLQVGVNCDDDLKERWATREKQSS